MALKTSRSSVEVQLTQWNLLGFLGSRPTQGNVPRNEFPFYPDSRLLPIRDCFTSYRYRSRDYRSPRFVPRCGMIQWWIRFHSDWNRDTIRVHLWIRRRDNLRFPTIVEFHRDRPLIPWLTTHERKKKKWPLHGLTSMGNLCTFVSKKLFDKKKKKKISLYRARTTTIPKEDLWIIAKN